MKSKSRKKRYFFIFLTLLIGSVIHSCSKTDLSLINKLNTFRPRWSTMLELVDEVNGHLKITEERYEKDFQEVEAFLDQLADSLKDNDYKKMLKNYDGIIKERDSLRKTFDGINKFYEARSTVFSKWENEVKSGAIERTKVDEELKTYGAQCDSIENICNSIDKDIKASIEVHNKILRTLNEYLERFENQDIKLR